MFHGCHHLRPRRHSSESFLTVSVASCLARAVSHCSNLNIKPMGHCSGFRKGLRLVAGISGEELGFRGRDQEGGVAGQGGRGWGFGVGRKTASAKLRASGSTKSCIPLRG